MVNLESPGGKRFLLRHHFRKSITKIPCVVGKREIVEEREMERDREGERRGEEGEDKGREWVGEGETWREMERTRKGQQ